VTLALNAAVARPRKAWRKFALYLRAKMPKGLFVRSVLIVILPMLLLQSAVAFFFLERHWQVMTRQLSAVLAQEIAALADVYETYPQDKGSQSLARIAAERMRIDAEIMPLGPLPPPVPKPFFSFGDSVLSNQIREQVGRPFWLDTIGRSNIIEIRVQLKDAVLRVLAHRSQAYASNTYIFMMWMAGTALILIAISVLYLRNQIKPILRLARAAEAFGKGRDIHFRASGAREVKLAGRAFLDMRTRIERAREQRTTMLNGVSHDLRTILTRFRLSLELLPENHDKDSLRRDVGEMERMLEAYLAFARGDAGENASPVDMQAMLSTLVADVRRQGKSASLAFKGPVEAVVRPDAFRRCLANLVANAQRYAHSIAIKAEHDGKTLVVHVDDDGPGIPPDLRDDAFRPFYRLDEARNQDEGGTGLGLAIARDIARSHGGDISLETSPLGGLRATVTVPG
jgi:two-component system osmolarity sensor histidine kinase EnvZ